MKTLFKFVSLFILFSMLGACEQQQSAKTKIGVIVPLEHAAMREIVAGFNDTILAAATEPVTIDVENAQNDPNLQRAIIQQMQDKQDAILVPIGTTTTQMTVAMVHEQPIVSLAATFSEKDRKHLKTCNIAVVHDEIPPAKMIAFIHQVYPNIKNIALIHSASDKVFPEIKAAEAAAKQYHLQIHSVMAATLPDLNTVVQALPRDTQAIYVLKDSLIVSGIATLAKNASDRQIPLLTSDQGSVEGGADFAVGVPERAIGVAGAKLALAILQGKKPCDLPITEMTDLTVFINAKRLQTANLSIDPIEKAAKKMGYAVVMVQPQGGQ